VQQPDVGVDVVCQPFEIPGHDGVRQPPGARPLRLRAQHIQVVQLPQHVLHRAQPGYERPCPHQTQLAGQLERVAQPLGGDADRVHAIDDQDSPGAGHRDPERAGAIDHAAGQSAALPAGQAAMAASRRQVAIVHQIGEPGQEPSRPSRIDSLGQVLERRAPPLGQVGPQRHRGRRRLASGAGGQQHEGDVQLADRPERGRQPLQAAAQPTAAAGVRVDDDRQDLAQPPGRDARLVDGVLVAVERRVEVPGQRVGAAAEALRERRPLVGDRTRT
jgi:hypothetical protein